MEEKKERSLAKNAAFQLTAGGSAGTKYEQPLSQQTPQSQQSSTDSKIESATNHSCIMLGIVEMHKTEKCYYVKTY